MGRRIIDTDKVNYIDVDTLVVHTNDGVKRLDKDKLPIPTKTSDLNNDSNFLDATTIQNIDAGDLNDDGTYIKTSLKGVNNGVAELDATGKVPSNQLPSYVSDIKEYSDESSFPVSGESGIIYIAKDTNFTYRWTGTGYTKIGDGNLVLGETSATAYRGDRGKEAYDHISKTNNPHNVTYSQLSGKPTIPTNNNQLTNGSKYVTYNGSAKNVYNIWVGTQAQYDAIGTKSSTTLYFIEE